jgi:2,4-dienoyl-CoA reductase-like NADH-dependent reductase (Old Yellow Enzyme family)
MPNRLVMAPMVTGLANKHFVTDAHLAWYRKRAQAGVGLVIVESCGIDPAGTIIPNMLGIWDDTFVPGLRRLAESIQIAGIPAVLQIVHGGARSFRPDLGVERIAPSAVALAAGPPPRAMTDAEITAVIASFASAAKRSKDAGFDGVEIHAAHYYLLSEFLSPKSNLRSDTWGGSRENRARLAVDVVKAVRQAVGSDYPILCRMHAVEFVEGGMDDEDIRFTAQVLQDAGVDLLNASGVGQSSLGEWEGQTFLNTSSVLPKSAPAGTFGPFTKRLKVNLKIPVIAVGKLAEPGLAQRVLDEDQADLVAIARQLIADPMTAEKLLNHREEDILRCKECLACFAAIRSGAITCGVNPTS